MDSAPAPSYDSPQGLTPLQMLIVKVKTEFDLSEITLSPKAYQALLEIVRMETEVRLARFAVMEAERITAEP